jgi:hypothetical protein
MTCPTGARMHRTGNLALVSATHRAKAASIPHPSLEREGWGHSGVRSMAGLIGSMPLVGKHPLGNPRCYNNSVDYIMLFAERMSQEQVTD